MGKRKPREDFVTIPQAPRYELNSAGVLRNRETGQILKWQFSGGITKIARLSCNKKKLWVSLPGLLWQLHGRKAKTQAIPVVISRGIRSVQFNSCHQCALYFVKYHGLKFSKTSRELVRRAKTIGGWNVKYLL